MYVDEGSYTATLTVSDGDGGVGTDSVQVTVANVAPTADAGGDRSGLEGSGVAFAGAATDPGTSDTLSYSWDFGDGGTGTGASPSHAYVDEGVFTATLTVSDGDGGVGTDSVQVTISNVAPTADAGEDRSGPEGSAIAFAGAASDPGSSDTLTHSWDFGDGGAATGVSPTHVYADEGVYTATLTVSDGDGGVDTDSLQVTISNVAPIADAGSDATIDEGGSVSFSGSASDPGAGDVLTFAWDFGDGVRAAGATPTHTYVQDGRYTVVLTATDDSGAASNDQVIVTVRNVAPVVTPGGDVAGEEGATVALSSAASDVGVLDVLTTTWDFGDGSTGAGAAPQHAYAQDGVFTATVTVTDDAGASASADVTVTIANVAPDVPLPAEVVADVGTDIVVPLAPTDPSPDDLAALEVAWQVRDAAGGVLASGAGTDVRWSADRKVTGGRLVVTLRDDDVETVREAVVTANTPPLGDSFAPVLELVLDAKSERKILGDLVAADKAAGAAAGKPRLMRKARALVGRALGRVEKAGVVAGPLHARLVALEADLGQGVAPPPSPSFVAPEAAGGVDEMLALLPRAGFPPRESGRLAAALLDVRYAQRTVRPRAVLSAQKDGLKVLLRLPASAARDWFYASLSAAE